MSREGDVKLPKPDSYELAENRSPEGLLALAKKTKDLATRKALVTAADELRQMKAQYDQLYEAYRDMRAKADVSDMYPWPGDPDLNRRIRDRD